jgi:putative ABC transport system substrate-binding protein
MTVTIGRRELLAALGGAAAAWPIAPRAQQSSMPVIGFLNSETPIGFAPQAAAFRQGVSEAGYVEGENVAIVYRWADNQVGRLPVNLGLVASLARPNGNLTGINFFNSELVAKRLELLRELVPAATRVAVLVNPANAANAETTLRDVEAAARVIGLQIQVLNASTNREISAAFTTLVRQRSDVPFVGNDAFFATRRVQIAILAARHAVPAVYAQRDFAEAGGLMSYGSSITDAFRQVGAYTSKCCPLCRRKRTSDLCVNETRPDLTQRFQKSTRKWPGRRGVRFIALSRSLCVSAAGSGSVCIRQSLRLAG